MNDHKTKPRKLHFVKSINNQKNEKKYFTSGSIIPIYITKNNNTSSISFVLFESSYAKDKIRGEQKLIDAGGAVEQNEETNNDTIEETAVRELYEESCMLLDFRKHNNYINKSFYIDVETPFKTTHRCIMPIFKSNESLRCLYLHNMKKIMANLLKYGDKGTGPYTETFDMVFIPFDEKNCIVKKDGNNPYLLDDKFNKRFISARVANIFLNFIEKNKTDSPNWVRQFVESHKIIKLKDHTIADSVDYYNYNHDKKLNVKNIITMTPHYKIV